MKFLGSHRNLLLALAVTALWTSSASAAVSYWDTNGSTAGSGNAGGNWWLSSNWSTDSTGSSATNDWNNGDSAYFSAGSDGTGSLSIDVNQTGTTVNNLTVNQGNITLTGNPLALSTNSTWTVANGSSLVANNGSLNLTSTGNFNLQAGLLTTTSASATGGTLTSTYYVPAVQGLMDFGSAKISGTGNITLVSNSLPGQLGGSTVTVSGNTATVAAAPVIQTLRVSGSNNYWGATTVNPGAVVKLMSPGTPFGTKFGAAAGAGFNQLTLNRQGPSTTGGTDGMTVLPETNGTLDLNGNSGTVGLITGNGLITSNVAGAVNLTIAGPAAYTNVQGGSPRFLDGAGQLSLTITGSDRTQTGTSGSSHNIQVLMNGNGNHISGTVTVSHATVQAWQNDGLLRYGADTPYNNLNPFGTADVVLDGAVDTARSVLIRGAVLEVNSNNLDIPSLSGNGAVMAMKISSSKWQVADVFVGSNNHSTTFSGAIDGAVHLTKVGTGTLTFSGTNFTSYDHNVSGAAFFEGVTELNGGVFELATSRSSAFGGSITPGRLLFNGGTLRYTAAANGLSGQGLDVSGNLSTNGQGTVVTYANANTFVNGNAYFVSSAGTVSSSNPGPRGSSWKVDLNGNTVTWASALKDGGAASDAALHGSLTLVGNTGGKMILTNAGNTFVGPTTVGSGLTLQVNGALANSPVTVNTSGTLTGNGTVAAAEIKSGATLAPSDFTTLTVSSSGLVLDAGALAHYALDKQTNSSLVRANQLTLNGQNFADFSFDTTQAFGLWPDPMLGPNFGIEPGYYPLVMTPNVILGALGGSTVGTVYDPLNAITYGAKILVSDDGHNLYLNVYVPEPSTIALLGLGGLSLAVAAWRRRRKAA